MEELIKEINEEHEELNEKLERLTDFILSDQFENNVPEAHQILLRSQATAMATYDNILIARIKDLERK